MRPLSDTKIIITGIVFLASLAVFSFLGNGVWGSVARAEFDDNVYGWAWSDNVGWVSFNCIDTGSCAISDYGVTIDDQGGEVSGYAWNENIGWISFTESDLDGCPSGSCRAKLSGNSLQGWARALSASDGGSGGWDGFIKLNGSSYGVTLDGAAFTGFAWGSDVVGWIDFAPQMGGVLFGTPALDPPTVSLTANPSAIEQGDSSEIAWSGTGADSCSGFNFSTGDATSGTVAVTPDETITYGLVCTNDSGSTYDEATVTVSSPDGGGGGGGGGEPLPEVSISANPSIIRVGRTTTINWSSSNAESCEVSGPGGFFASSLSGSQTSGAITQQSVFIIVCENADGAVESAGVTVFVTPIFEEI